MALKNDLIIKISSDIKDAVKGLDTVGKIVDDVAEGIEGGFDSASDEMIEDMRRATRGVGDSLDKLEREADAVFDEMEDDAKDAGIGIREGLLIGFGVEAVRRSMDLMVGAVKTGFNALTTFAGESIEAFTILERQMAALNATAKQTGNEGVLDMIDGLEAVKLGLLSTGGAAEALQALLAAGLSGDEAIKTLEALADRTALNDTTTRGFEESVKAVAKSFLTLETEGLKTIGVVAKLDKENKKYAATLGITVDQLTNAQRAQVLANVAQETAAGNAGDLNVLLTTQAGLNQALEVSVNNVRESLGKAVTGALTPFKQALVGEDGILAGITAWVDKNQEFIEQKIQGTLLEIAAALPTIAKAFGLVGKSAALALGVVVLTGKGIADVFGGIITKIADDIDQLVKAIGFLQKFSPAGLIADLAGFDAGALDLTSGLRKGAAKYKGFGESAQAAVDVIIEGYNDIDAGTVALVATLERLESGFRNPAKAAEDLGKAGEDAGGKLGEGADTATIAWGEFGSKLLGASGLPAALGLFDKLGTASAEAATATEENLVPALNDVEKAFIGIKEELPEFIDYFADWIPTAAEQGSARMRDAWHQATADMLFQTDRLAGSVAGIGESMEGIQVQGRDLTELFKIFGVVGQGVSAFTPFGAVQAPDLPGGFDIAQFDKLFEEFGASFPFASLPTSLWEDQAESMRRAADATEEMTQRQADESTRAEDAARRSEERQTETRDALRGAVAEVVANLTVNTVSVASAPEQKEAVLSWVPFLREAFDQVYERNSRA